MSANDATVTGGTMERIRKGLGALAAEELANCDGIATLRCGIESAREVLQALRATCGFELCTMVTAVDHAETDCAPDQRIDMIWQLQSVEHMDRVRLHSWLPGEESWSAPSVMDLWPSAAYNERECYDMFGVGFEGHEGLKRILMPEAYDHFPLLKEFPHSGIEPDRLYKAWDRSRRLPAPSAREEGPA